MVTDIRLLMELVSKKEIHLVLLAGGHTGEKGQNQDILSASSNLEVRKEISEE